jgi:hypothetical protein
MVDKRVGLGPQVTLQVKHVPAAQLAEVVPLEGGKPISGVSGSVQAVEVARYMYRGAGVPVLLMGNI